MQLDAAEARRDRLTRGLGIVTDQCRYLVELQRAVDAANTKVSRAESIRAFQVLPDDFTEASGELTPKLSIKRAVILDQRSDAVDRLYTDAKAHREASAAH